MTSETHARDIARLCQVVRDLTLAQLDGAQEFIDKMVLRDPVAASRASVELWHVKAFRAGLLAIDGGERCELGAKEIKRARAALRRNRG